MKIVLSNDKNLLKFALFILILIFVVCTIALFQYYHKVSHFTKVPARIVDVSIKYDNKNNDNQNRNKYIQYVYNYSGKQYTGNKLSLFANKKLIGTEVKISINPNKPEEIKNNMYIIIYSFASVISLALFLLIMIGLRRR